MSVSRNQLSDDVEQLLLNAQLRDELEPLSDESIRSLQLTSLPTPVENEFLASMLAWERAPTLPIASWFNPELRLRHPDSLTDERISSVLGEIIQKLFGQRIVLDFTDHLSDRQLYCLIYRDILPAREKKIESLRHFLHWDCANVSDDPEIWLRYYASAEDRETWAVETGEALPDAEEPPHPRNLPRAPM
ncbi:MAG: hypothetical protein KDA42_01845 [Planctomycetales bacterium]|nr:hypothetical protein [Planctomycetales bacterium]